MNKIFKLAILPLALLGMAVSCEDARETNMVPDGVLLSTAKYSENVATVSVFEGTFSFNVFKSGKGTSSGAVAIDTPSSLVAWYNENYGTDYVALPEGSYSVSAKDFDFREDAVTKQVLLFWDPKAVSDAIAPGQEAVIPIKIKDSNLQILEGTDYLLVKMVRPSICLDAQDKAIRASLNSTYKDTQKFDVTIDTRVDREAIVTFIMDPSFVDVYNEQNGTSFLPALSRMVELPMKAVIPANTSSATVDYTVLSEQFYNTFKESGAVASTVLAPIRILSATIDGVDMPFNADPFYLQVSPAIIPDVMFCDSEYAWPALAGFNGTDVIKAQVGLSEVLTGLDSQINIMIDESYVATWNEQHGKNYAGPRSGLITIPSDVVIPANELSANFELSINRAGYSSYGDFEGIVIPLVIKSLNVSGTNITIVTDPTYIVLEQPAHRVITGADNGGWELLEGEEWGKDPIGETGTQTYYDAYSSKGLCDGVPAPDMSDFTAYRTYHPFESVQQHTWLAWFTSSYEQFPIQFVYDMKVPHVFDTAWKRDWDYPGTYDIMTFYFAEEYDGANTKWESAGQVDIPTVPDGTISEAAGFNKWDEGKFAKGSATIPSPKIGRYIKIEMAAPKKQVAGGGGNNYGGITDLWFEGK